MWSAIPVKSRNSVGIEHRLHPRGDRRDVRGDPARLGCELSDVGKGGARPLVSPLRHCCPEVSKNVGIFGRIIEADDRRLPFSKQGPRRGNDGRARGKRDALVDLQVCLDPVVLREADGLDPPDAHPPQHDGIADAETADRSEASVLRFRRRPESGLGKPKSTRGDDHERCEDRRADDQLVAPLHGVAPEAIASASPPASGRPSMNWRTIGSCVRWICSTVPTCRIWPRYSIAILSPTA